MGRRRLYPDKDRFPRQCRRWQRRFSPTRPLLLQTQSETEGRWRKVKRQLNPTAWDSLGPFCSSKLYIFPANSCIFFNLIPHVFLCSCLMLAVALELHCCSQPSDALFAALLPEQLVPAVIFKVQVELACAWAVHVVVKLQTLRSPGAPQWVRQQSNTLTG